MGCEDTMQGEADIVQRCEEEGRESRFKSDVANRAWQA